MSDKPIRIAPHAAQNLQDREIPPGEVYRTIDQPEAVAPSYDRRRVYMRRYHDTILNQVMLLRVVVEESPRERVVVTVYKTSRIERYIKGATL